MTAIAAASLQTVTSTGLRTRFAAGLSRLYASEVPLYQTLVDVSQEVNERVLRRHGADAERLGSIARVTAERHGAIRVGSPAELAQVARVFGALGMHPCGFYDLRAAHPQPIPVVSTAFRPLDRAELATNPFRVFTSMLVPEASSTRTWSRGCSGSSPRAGCSPTSSWSSPTGPGSTVS